MSDTGLVKTPDRQFAPVLRREPEPETLVSEVRRFAPDTDIDAWLLKRLDARWSGFSEAAWRSKMTSFANSNAHLFVTNGRCVMLMAVFGAHAITGKTVLIEVFAMSRDAHSDLDGNWILPKGAEAPLAALYRAGRDWMRDMGAARAILGTCSDMAPSVVKNAAGGYYIVDLVNR